MSVTGTPVDVAVNALSTAKTAYLDNADYDIDGDTAKCRLFIQAARKLQLLLTEETEHGGARSHAGLNLKNIMSELDAARKWLAARDSSFANRNNKRFIETTTGFGS